MPQITTRESYFSKFLLILFVTLIIKITLCKIIPVTADEGYYYSWAEYLSWGYRDHPPLIAWIMHPFLLLGSNPIILRLPTVLMTMIIGTVMYVYLRAYDDYKAFLTSAIFLISPLSLCAVIITTDTSVILFSFLSAICVLLAIRHQDHLGLFALAGLFLGLAFFSKYFAVLLGVVYAVYFIFIARSKKRFIGLGLIILLVLPFGLENLYWNYTHSWANITYNLYTRNETNKFSLETVIIYLLTLFYIITPPLCYYLVKYRRQLFTIKQPEELYFLNYLIFIPLLFFLALSTYKTIGMHWPLSFILFVYLWAGLLLTPIELEKIFKFMLWFTLAHLVLIAVLSLTPVQLYQKYHLLSDKNYAKWVFFNKHPQIRASLNQYNNNYTFASLNYAQAVLMYYDSGLYEPTFGIGSVHSRQDDLITDFKQLDGKNILIFYSREPKEAEYQPYFAHSDVHSFQYDGATFYYILGDRFNYPAYRDTVLRYIYVHYWPLPTFLPHTPNYFCEKYFAFEGCE